MNINMYMTTKHNKGFTSLDAVLRHHMNPHIVIGMDAIRSNPVNRSSEENYLPTLATVRTKNDYLPNLTTLAQSKIETVRIHSPTSKHLLAARIKPINDLTPITRIISANQRSLGSICETTYSFDNEKQSFIDLQTQSLSSTKSPSVFLKKPFNETTCAQPWSNNDKMQQKLSLEIWLPKATLDDDDGDDNEDMFRSTISDTCVIERDPRTTPIPDSNINTTTTVPTIETKHSDEESSKISEFDTIPHVDMCEEQSNSCSSVMTLDSDGDSLIRRSRHLRTARRSVTPNEDKELLRFKTVELPTTAANLSDTTRQSSNPSMISKFVQKYSIMKKNQQKLLQAKLQLENSTNESKDSSDQSSRVRPSITLASSNHPTISVNNLFLNTSPTVNNRIERCATPRKLSNSDISPQLRVYYLANQRQHHRSSVVAVPNTVLPAISKTNTNDTCRTFQRSKTLNIVLNVPSPIKVTSYTPSKSHTSSSFERTNKTAFEQTSSLLTKRSAFTFRSKPRPGEVSIVQNSVQYFHLASTRPNE